MTDPIYFTDDYPRAGCGVSIDVMDDGYSLRISAPDGHPMEVYAKVKTPRAIGRMVEEWCSGLPPRLHDRLDQPSCGSALAKDVRNACL